MGDLEIFMLGEVIVSHLKRYGQLTPLTALGLYYLFPEDWRYLPLSCSGFAINFEKDLQFEARNKTLDCRFDKDAQNDGELL